MYFNNKFLNDIWKDKYAYGDEQSPSDMFKRMTREFKRIEDKYPHPLSEEEITEMIDDYKYFIPAGSVAFGIGTDRLTSLANCFFVGNEYDSYGGIFSAEEEMVQLEKRRGGVGLDLSHIREKGSQVNNAARTSTGIVPFMERYSNATREVAQDGRRGALILSLDIKHPDRVGFIKAKDDLTKVTGANISLKIGDDFMEAVEKGTDTLTTIFHGKEITIDVKKVWNLLIHQMWKVAEPGILFWDTVHKEGVADYYPQFRSKGVNPCGEVPLSPYSSCRLAAINLFSFVKDPFTKNAMFKWSKLRKIAYRAQRLMDDIVDLEEEKLTAIINKIKEDPEPHAIKNREKMLWVKIRNDLREGRRTGMGVMGLADALAALGLSYDDKKALNISKNIMKNIAVASYLSSIDMAKERGAFKNFNSNNEWKIPYLKHIMANMDYPTRAMEEYARYGRRNIANLSIAPTGTISMMAQVSPGIEPIFNIHYTRRRKVNEDNPNKKFLDSNGDWWEEVNIFHPKFKMWYNINVFPETEISLEEYWKIHEKDKKALDDIIALSPYYGSTVNEIDPIQKVIMQGAIQKWVDHSISVTYNLPVETTEEEISDLALMAWKAGCKGITIYREGSRQGIMVNNDNKEQALKHYDAPKRPKVLEADIFFPTIKGNKYIVLVGKMKEEPYEVFCFQPNGVTVPSSITHGLIERKKRGLYNLLDVKGNIIVEDIITKFKKPVEEFATRLISTSLRHGADIKFVVEQLNKSGGQLTDYSRVIARTLKKYVKNGTKVSGEQCPICGGTLEYREGCVTCPICGYSRCD